MPIANMPIANLASQAAQLAAMVTLQNEPHDEIAVRMPFDGAPKIKANLGKKGSGQGQLHCTRGLDQHPPQSIFCQVTFNRWCDLSLT